MPGTISFKTWSAKARHHFLSDRHYALFMLRGEEDFFEGVHSRG
jgi:uncharacterized protein (UPF0218 family)